MLRLTFTERATLIEDYATCRAIMVLVCSYLYMQQQLCRSVYISAIQSNQWRGIFVSPRHQAMDGTSRVDGLSHVAFPNPIRLNSYNRHGITTLKER